jgi:hypothetical protein
MFDGRIYRAAFVPLLLALAIVGFSLSSRPAGLASTLAPDAFNGVRAFANLRALAKHFPDRRPGSAGDNELAAYVAQSLRELAGTAGGGFQVSVRRVHARTIDGARTLTTVIAERPGSTGGSPIAILAHRDAPGRGSAAELSGTAALLELAHVFSQSETRRTIVLVSTSGGSGGYAGAADFARTASAPLDAAIALGDLAGDIARTPFVLPFSSGSAMAPESLQLTLDAAISQEVGANAGSPSAGAQFAHLSFPLSTGEQASLNASRIPSVLVQVSGERGPTPTEPIGEAGLQNFGRAVLSATYALDEGPNIAESTGPRLVLGRKALPGWAVRLLVIALLLPPLLMSVDALARLRRHREPVLRWILWTLTCALPMFACVLFAMTLGALGVIAAPFSQLSVAALASDGSSSVGVIACAVLLASLSLLVWPALVRGLSFPVRPSAEGAGLATMLVLFAVALVVWIFNPFACLLLVPALHLWPVVISSRGQPGSSRRMIGLLAVCVALLPILLLFALYTHELGLGPGALLQSVVLTLAGGQVGPLGGLLWSVGFGCLLAAVLLAAPARPASGESNDDWLDISTRGPLSYAGPGSLGGTESALRH